MEAHPVSPGLFTKRSKIMAPSRLREDLSPAALETENALHKAAAEYLDWVIHPPSFWTTFPAGGGGKIRGAQLKALGLKPGMPDLMIFAPGGKVLGIELKRPTGGSWSDEQKAMAERFKDCGMWYVLCRSVEEVGKALDFIKIPRAAA